MTDRAARLSDVHEIAAGMPQPDAVDPDTGERLGDVIMIWVESESEKLALVQDPDSPFFTTNRFDDHSSVLIRASRLADVSRTELAELIHDGWLSRASKRRAEGWVAANRK
jgi:hypothetical protein